MIDCCGTKRDICAVGFHLAREHGFLFVGGHPMAGTHFSGFKYSRATLFKGAPMVLVPPVFDDMQLIDRFKIVRFDNERYLQKMGSSLYKDTDITGPAYIAEGKERPVVLQSYVETSNVNVVNEMVSMIEVNRAYEANQKTIQAQDTMMSTLWGKVVLAR